MFRRRDYGVLKIWLSGTLRPPDRDYQQPAPISGKRQGHVPLPEFRHRPMENHVPADQGVPAPLSTTRSASGFSQSALLRTLEPGQPGNIEAVAIAACRKGQTAKGRGRDHTYSGSF